MRHMLWDYINILIDISKEKNYKKQLKKNMVLRMYQLSDTHKGQN